MARFYFDQLLAYILTAIRIGRPMGPPVAAPRSRRRDCLAVEIARLVETKTVPMHQAAMGAESAAMKSYARKGGKS